MTKPTNMLTDFRASEQFKNYRRRFRDEMRVAMMDNRDTGIKAVDQSLDVAWECIFGMAREVAQEAVLEFDSPPISADTDKANRQLVLENQLAEVLGGRNEALNERDEWKRKYDELSDMYETLEADFNDRGTSVEALQMKLSLSESTNEALLRRQQRAARMLDEFFVWLSEDIGQLTGQGFRMKWDKFRESYNLYYEDDD